MKRKGYDMVRYDNLFVVLMGMGVVFFGLICIILLTMAMGKVLQPRKELTAVKEAAKGKASLPETAGTDMLAKGSGSGIRPEILAIITSVLAGEMGVAPFEMNIIDIKRV
ncbi:MAG: OadG family protein [Lachnospiraceae bacterium]|nr:OadG family protein [Lachnospiraceae bacterium]